MLSRVLYPVAKQCFRLEEGTWQANVSHNLVNMNYNKRATVHMWLDEPRDQKTPFIQSTAPQVSLRLENSRSRVLKVSSCWQAKTKCINCPSSVMQQKRLHIERKVDSVIRRQTEKKLAKSLSQIFS